MENRTLWGKFAAQRQQVQHCTALLEEKKSATWGRYSTNASSWTDATKPVEDAHIRHCTSPVLVLS